MMTNKIFFWLLLVMLLSISTFGIWTCSIVFMSICFFSFAFFATIHAGNNIHLPSSITTSSMKKKCDNFPFAGIPKVAVQMLRPTNIMKFDKRLTGSTEIDGPLREIMSYIERDFLRSWYGEVSSNSDFIANFNELCKSIINNFSKSSKEVNWVSFITHRVVEDFTSHLRLFRHSEVAYRKKQRENRTCHPSIEAVFFDKEYDPETKICRESVCSSLEKETEYLQSLCDMILYLLLPPEDFSNKVLKHFMREMLTTSVLQPLLAQFSDPDIINQNLIWLCKDHVVNSKSLLSILRRTENQDELTAFIQISKHELKVRNSKDSGDKDEMKKYMKSIQFVQNIAHQRLERVLGFCKSYEADSSEFYLDFDSTDGSTYDPKGKLVSLPFDVILNNNIALHYFTQYLTNIDAEGYVFFYHNIVGFKTTVAQLMNSDGDQEQLRGLATQLFESYLSASATSKIHLEETLLKKLSSRLKTETVTESCFDEVQEKVYGILENEFYINGFKDSKMYVKLLAELDLLHDLSPSSDLDSLSSSKSEEEEKFNCDTVVPTDEDMLNEFLKAEISSEIEFPQISSGPLSTTDSKEIGLLFAEVHSTGITHHAGRTFAIYAISVSHYKMDGSEEKWFVGRRYSEFYDFHEEVIKKYPILASFNFPSKKPFNNLTRQLMEKRRTMLNDFIQFLLLPDILSSCEDLKPMLYNFLQPNISEKGKKSNAKSVGTFINPIKSSARTVGQFVRMVPDTFFELKDGFIKAFSKNNANEPTVDERPVITKDGRADDIPFRIMLLLMDEVFNLRNKDLWFRRRIMALLRQIIKTMQGGSINKKIKEYVQGMTSVTQMAEWLKLLSKTIWPDGKLAAPAPERDFNTKMRTRIVAKMFLFCAIPDELKHIIGYETSFRGAMLIFNMFQYPALNRRLFLVLLESFLKTLFPNNKFPDIIKKLHFTPSRTDSISVASFDAVSQQSDTSEISKKSESVEVTVTESTEKPAAKIQKETKTKVSLSCLPQQNLLPSPKPQKRQKKSAESAIFYMDIQNDEDKVILPLN